MDPHKPEDLKTLLLEVLSDTRLIHLFTLYRRLSCRKKRLLVRLARALTT